MKSLADQMGVYASYHNDATNRFVHYLFVPLIVWSAMGLLVLPGAVNVGGVAVTLAHVAAAALLGYYLRLDFAYGVAMAVLFTVLLVAALGAALRLGSLAFPVFLLLFAASWAAQIVGHFFFEGRKPALSDDLFQVLVAPIFVVAEWSFSLGLRPQLQEEVAARVARHLSAWERERA
ncbi:MAG: Mpo1 family 2-hydroxy fatty acid dioxygenase [Thermoplasmatota archaeon]